MIKTRNITNKTFLKMTAFLLFPASLFGGAMLMQDSTTHAEVSYIAGHSAEVTLTNPSFASGSTSGSTFTGWSVIETEAGSKANGRIVDIGNKVESAEGDVDDKTFADNNNKYYFLDSNPGRKDKGDNRILMINSKSDKSQKNVNERKGYKSSSISLEANSYYIFSVSALAMLNGDDFVEGSIYVNGLKDKNGVPFDLGYEKISPNAWTDYYFFIATGNQKQDINLQLYLGSKSTTSQGAVFFDGAKLFRYSHNEFMTMAYTHGYANADNTSLSATDKVFMVDKLVEEKEILSETQNMNFDFEDTTASFADNWSILAQPNGNVQIVNYADFSSTTGLSPIGNDLQYNNEHGLAMWTTSSEYSSYLGIQSKDIKIAPHQVYKISMKMKTTGLESGSFYLQVTENDYIYSVYPELLSNDDQNEKYYDLKSGKTNGYTTNAANSWTNDYQTIEYYVKGHALYSSSINIEFWLGDSSASAVGGVIIDDITVENVTDGEVDDTNLLKLSSSNEVTADNNASFDVATKDSDSYPLTASAWTTSKGSESACESGVIYLGNRDAYDTMYATYDWAGINPYNSNGTQNPTNVYMMYNRTNSHQSIQSPSFSLSGSEYYTLSFDFYTQDKTALNKSKIRVDAVDSNGIVLFSQSGISSADEWSKMEIAFRSTSSKSHDITLKIYLGEEDAPVGGTVYLDNFAVTSATEEIFAGAMYSTDMTGFYTHLDGADATEVVASSAYKFDAQSYDNDYSNGNDAAFGGIVSGKNNPYDVVNEHDNFLALTTKVASKASLTSNFTLNFDANGYYKLTFSLATLFNPEAENASTDEHACKYGVSIKLDGYEEIATLVTNGSLKDYTIFFKVGESATTPSLIFTLTSDCASTTGSALLTNLALTTSNADEYTFEMTKSTYGESVFTSEKATEVEDDDKTEDDDTTTDEEAPTKQDTTSTAWIAVPSIITGLAVIVGVAALIFKNLKIKKIEKVKQQAYDKRVNNNHGIVMAQAQRRRDEELKMLIEKRDAFEAEKASLEAQHKEFMRVQREKSNGKISREIEKAFKQYNSRISILNEKINIIKEKIGYTMSAEYLIEIERKIISEQDKIL